MKHILDPRYKNTVRACYLTSISTSVTGNLSPLLFLTFRDLYGLSFAEMGLLVLINFTTQLLVDLAFTVLSRKGPTEWCVRYTAPVIALGLILFGTLPLVMPAHAMLALVIGTVIFSVGGGLAEVLTSPTVSAVPSDNSERLLSRLHAAYAWGVVAIVPPATLYLHFIARELWYILPLGFSLLPILASILYFTSPLPTDPAERHDSDSAEPSAPTSRLTVALCVMCIFFGGASECTMAQWCSGYIEEALGIGKLWGDIFGVALFGAALGLGRTLYSAFGKSITPCLLYGSLGALVCYLVAALSPLPLLSLVACAATGFFVSMLWPGTLIAAGERIPGGGVMIFALLAAGGDLGAALVPQGVGAVADLVALSPAMMRLAETLGLTAGQLGMRAGLLLAALFPLGGVLTVLALRKRKQAAPSGSDVAPLGQ